MLLIKVIHKNYDIVSDRKFVQREMERTEMKSSFYVSVHYSDYILRLSLSLSLSCYCHIHRLTLFIKSVCIGHSILCGGTVNFPCIANKEWLLSCLKWVNPFAVQYWWSFLIFNGTHTCTSVQLVPIRSFDRSFTQYTEKFT